MNLKALSALAVFPFLLGGEKTKPTLAPFVGNFEEAVEEASLRNVPLLFVLGKDH